MTIINNQRDSQYETSVDGHLAYAAYEMLHPDTIVFTHTKVPEALGGRGIAGSLAKFALDDVRARKLKVIARCPFIKAYIEKHPEYQDLLSGTPPSAAAE
jgi:predicted GNAT family acetyltransferase